MRARLTLLTAMPLLALLAACGGEAEVTADTPSGLPVPRWISVRGSPASMRAGPGFDYPILWRFERSGAPLQVVTETREWRKVCGPDGSIAWIHRSLTSGRSRAVSLRAVPMRAEPRADASVRAQLTARATVSLDECEAGWCRVSVGEVRGWTPQNALFGTASAPVCDARAPATVGSLAIQPGG